MGVLNVTPDSFSDGGQLWNCDRGRVDLGKVKARAEKMWHEGALFLDVGGESTRPGASRPNLQEEMDRVLPAIAAIRDTCPVAISVDTSSPELMLAAVEAGASLINDVRALSRPGALQAAKTSGASVCLMHMQGKPSTMQTSPQYADVVAEVYAFLESRCQACTGAGIPHENILIDPGFGFGKTLEHNLALLARLDEFCEMGYEVVVGVSRKSMIGTLTGRDLDQRLAGSLAVATLAVERGATLIRSHDVAATLDAVKVATTLLEQRQEALA